MIKRLWLLGLLAICLNISGQFNEEFLNKNKYGWDTAEKYYSVRAEKLARQKLLQIYDLKKQHIMDNALKSTVLPGWGQLSAQSYTKGQILIGSEIFLLGAFIYYNDKYLTEYDNYKKADYIVDIEKHYDKASEYYATSRSVIGLGIAVWLFGIIDSYFTTSNYNQEVWDSLYKEHQRKKIILSFSGITYRF